MAPGRMHFAHRVCASKSFILAAVILALFCDTFLYSFPVPILGYMIEHRLQIDPSQTQNIITALLSLHGLATLAFAPVIAHFAGKCPTRKAPFLISLAGCLVGTLLLSLTPSRMSLVTGPQSILITAVPALFIGRLIQGIAGVATWIVGSATLSDHVKLGKVYGVFMSLVSAGVVAGPAVAGAVLELAGYWTAWSVPLGLLLLDILMRCAMIESPRAPSTATKSSSPTPTPSTEPSEASALLQTINQLNNMNTADPDYQPWRDIGPEPDPDPVPEPGFYELMLSDSRVLVGLANTVLSSALLASFDTTLTLHIRNTFGWGPLAAGIMLLSLQLPFLLLGPLAGWVRDRAGLRYPTTVGWALLAPVMWLIGIPGSGIFAPESPVNTETMFIFAVVVFGVVVPFVRGAGFLQVSLVQSEFEAKDPSWFGYNGGSNRAFALQDIALSTGLMVGPLISGLLAESAGYYWASCAFAILCLLSAVASVFFLADKPVVSDADV
ncbi:hypothetical protein ASPVEDRAFT_173567 [Aspergillus versicolor CBS 583.65]|uniref:Major facilitator superfamily (MFS) profile domain-containing protein n=1 Tax=Aspergillus versicolor CBS 583.65 TaxID=1036611 RepID=A0A1L9PTQ4_ASPVE|nr:uncharacterized protein ASPVEDRAFT_173567 [Aspergillus versicolor CBS 583.65]OJJ04881.1 hypothetical protein ASPVEDRAFT_173567 [Aspergillus versicolor CBS 583.65]